MWVNRCEYWRENVKFSLANLGRLFCSNVTILATGCCCCSSWWPELGSKSDWNGHRLTKIITDKKRTKLDNCFLLLAAPDDDDAFNLILADVLLGSVALV